MVSAPVQHLSKIGVPPAVAVVLGGFRFQSTRPPPLPGVQVLAGLNKVDPPKKHAGQLFVHAFRQTFMEAANKQAFFFVGRFPVATLGEWTVAVA